MSKQQLLKSFGTLVFGAVIGYGVTSALLHPLDQGKGQTDLASLNEPRILSKFGAGQGYLEYFDARIKHDTIAPGEDGSSIVRGIIKAKRDIPAGLTFKWVLGKKVTSSEPLEGILPELKRGETKEMTFRLHGFSKADQTYLSLAVSGYIDGQFMTKETLSSSRPEDSFEYVVQQTQLQEDQMAARQNKSNGKASASSTTKKKFELQNIVK